MQALEGKDFFDNIRRSVKISHFVASIIPLALLVYFSLKYVYPYVTHGDVTKVPFDIIIILLLAVTVSVLGLILVTKATNSSIASAQELNTKLNNLSEITKQFRESLHLDTLLQVIMNSAIEIIAAESGALLLFDESGSLRYKAASGMNPEERHNRVIGKDEGVAAVVAKTGKPARMNDIPATSRHNTASGPAAKSVLCVPLVYESKILGVIELRNKKHSGFTKLDEALLQSLAGQGSISIVQNRLKEIQQSDLIHITELIVNAQDHIQSQKGHARRVAGYANRMGKILNFSETELRKLHYACLLHDIGRFRIDADEQWDTDKIMQHPKLGYDLIKSISLWSASADVILQHHERYNGTGYPLSNKADEIPLAARVLAVADSFDELTGKNPYQTQPDYQTALERIEANAGIYFDPQVVSVLKTVIADAGVLHD